MSLNMRKRPVSTAPLGGRTCRIPVVVAVVALSVFSACRDTGSSVSEMSGESEDTMATKTRTIEISSSAFSNGQTIPTKHTGDGEDISPPLRWSDLPEGAAELALICDDPDAPSSDPWVHWVIYAISPDIEGLPEGIAPNAMPRELTGALQGLNSWNTVGYRGPAPPRGHGRHHYHFLLYALDARTNLPAGVNKADLLAAMKGHILATGELTGLYER